MTLSNEAKYPSRRTFIVRVRRDASAHELAGRLENLVTGRERTFASGNELLDSIATDLKAGEEKPPAGSTGE